MRGAVAKAGVLTEALPYIRTYRGRIVVVKVGGEALDDPHLASIVAEDLALMALVGIELVVVHGGGPQVSLAMTQAGVQPSFVDGLRVTDAATMDIVQRVLVGSINPGLVARLNDAGLSAVGLSGVDGGLLEVEPATSGAGHDLGFVGEVSAVDTRLVSTLLADGRTPVVASVAPDVDGVAHNVNADSAAGAIAAALKAAKLVYLTNVEGLYSDFGDRDSLVSEVKLGELEAMLPSLSAGMHPKATSAVRALRAGVGKAHILDGRVEHALLVEVFTDEGIGTQVLLDHSSHPNGRSVVMLMNTYARMPVRFVSGRGARLTDDAGRSYIDFLAGIAVASVGHAHPLVAAAVAEQAATLIHVSNFFSTIPQERLAGELAELTGGMYSFFCNSGAESIEAALKLARKNGRAEGRDATRVVCAEGGFHGRTFGALSATGQPSKQAPFEPLVGGFVHVPYGDAAALEDVMDDGVAAVLLEPIQGEAGVVIPPSDYLASARKLCDETGALLILDEVQTGLGRTGAWFAWEHDGVSPDVMCLAKALAGGLPIGACLSTPKAAVFAPGDHATTFGGGPVQSAAALATLEVIKAEGLVGRAHVAGARLAAMLSAAFPDAAVRGRGLLLALEFERDVAHDIVERALGAGLVLNATSPTTLRICPPLVITDEELDHGFEILKEVTGAVLSTT